MLRCEACGEWQPDNCYRCVVCSKGPIIDVPESVIHRSKVNFVLDELPNWIRWGWISHETGEHISQHYRPPTY